MRSQRLCEESIKHSVRCIFSSSHIMLDGIKKICENKKQKGYPIKLSHLRCLNEHCLLCSAAQLHGLCSYCIDYKSIKSDIIKDRRNLLRVASYISSFEYETYIATLHGNKLYLWRPVARCDRGKTVFTDNPGLYIYSCMILAY